MGFFDKLAELADKHKALTWVFVVVSTMGVIKTAAVYKATLWTFVVLLLAPLAFFFPVSIFVIVLFFLWLCIRRKPLKNKECCDKDPIIKNFIKQHKILTILLCLLFVYCNADVLIGYYTRHVKIPQYGSFSVLQKNTAKSYENHFFEINQDKVLLFAKQKNDKYRVYDINQKTGEIKQKAKTIEARRLGSLGLWGDDIILYDNPNLTTFNKAQPKNTCTIFTYNHKNEIIKEKSKINFCPKYSFGIGNGEFLMTENKTYMIYNAKTNTYKGPFVYPGKIQILQDLGAVLDNGDAIIGFKKTESWPLPLNIAVLYSPKNKRFYTVDIEASPRGILKLAQATYLGYDKLLFSAFDDEHKKTFLYTYKVSDAGIKFDKYVKHPSRIGTKIAASPNFVIFSKEHTPVSIFDESDPRPKECYLYDVKRNKIVQLENFYQWISHDHILPDGSVLIAGEHLWKFTPGKKIQQKH